MGVELHVTYSPADLELLRRVAFGRCRAAGASVEDAQDCAQDAIASLLGSRDVEHPRAWIATVAYHRYVDVCRLRGREGSAGLMPTAAARISEPAGPEEEVVGRAHAHWLVGAMRGLPASTRSVCSAVGNGLPRQEVADRLGLTDRAVESHLTRARRSLRALSLLAAAAVLALGRVLRKVAPAGKPMAAVVVVPSLALVVVVGGDTHWDNEAGPDRPTPADVRPVPGLPVAEQDAPSPAPTTRPAEVPAGGVPGVDTPSGDLPGVGVPGVDVPGVDVPGVDVPSVGVRLPSAPAAPGVPRVPSPELPALPAVSAVARFAGPAVVPLPVLPVLPSLPAS